MRYVDLLRSVGAYVGIFLILTVPWLRVATHAAPTSPWGHAADDQVVAWILGWVAHALGTDPRHVMDANINYPAPDQLTGIEHFLSTQVVFAPVFWLSGNAVLGANAAAFLSYPLAAIAMERLLLALGCGRLAAWSAGLIFALGPLRVPAHLMLLKFPNLYFPLIALALTRLRAQPTGRRAALAGLVLGLAFLSSYYLAVMAAVLAAMWGGIELLRRGPGRLRFVALAATAAAAATGMLVAVSVPYLLRPEASAGPGAWSPVRALGNALAFLPHVRASGSLPLALAACGTVGLISRVPAIRRLALAGLVVSVAALILMRGPAEEVYGFEIPLPYAAIHASPARFFRAPTRFVILLGFGSALLAAAALDLAGRSLGRRFGGVAIAAVAAAVLATRGSALLGDALVEFAGQSEPIYDGVRHMTRGDFGALLELPAISPAFALAHPERPAGTEAEAMLASTRHWLPLVNGATHFPPPHRALVIAAIMRLPASEAVDELVDMVHLRWLLLRPREQWRAPELPIRAALLALPETTGLLSANGWALLRVDRVPRHPEWFAAIAAGQRSDRTVLGTALAPLPEDAARASVETSVPAMVPGARPFALTVTVRNVGSAAWPVVAPPRAGDAHTVHLVARWWSSTTRPTDATPSATAERALRRDVPPGGRLAQTIWLTAPEAPGQYELEIGVRQRGGADFEGPGNQRSATRVLVVPPGDDGPGAFAPREWRVCVGGQSTRHCEGDT